MGVLLWQLGIVVSITVAGAVYGFWGLGLSAFAWFCWTSTTIFTKWLAAVQLISILIGCGLGVLAIMARKEVKRTISFLCEGNSFVFILGLIFAVITMPVFRRSPLYEAYSTYAEDLLFYGYSSINTLILHVPEMVVSAFCFFMIGYKKATGAIWFFFLFASNADLISENMHGLTLSKEIGIYLVVLVVLGEIFSEAGVKLCRNGDNSATAAAELTSK